MVILQLEVPSLNLDPGLASSDFLGTSLAVSPNLLVVSPNLSARSLVASDRFSGGTTVPISLSDRVSLPLIHAPLNAAVSSSSLVTSSSTDMALAISVIEESRASDTVVSSLLDDSTLGSSASSASTPALSCHDWPPLSSPIKWGLPNPPPHPDEGLGWSNTSHRCAIAAAYCDLPKSSRRSVDCCVRQHRLGVSRVRPWGAFHQDGVRPSLLQSIISTDPGERFHQDGVRSEYYSSRPSGEIISLLQSIISTENGEQNTENGEQNNGEQNTLVYGPRQRDSTDREQYFPPSIKEGERDGFSADLSKVLCRSIVMQKVSIFSLWWECFTFSVRFSVRYCVSVLPSRCDTASVRFAFSALVQNC